MTYPIRIRRLAFTHVSAGENHACGVTTGKVVYCWGANFAGQLGRGTSTGPERCFGIAPCSTKPVPAAGGLSFDNVDSGNSHTCGVTTGGVVYCWGEQIGDGTTQTRVKPRRVAGAA
jgi:alpha-tubulin suppressor-like RCC1 family protein